MQKHSVVDYKRPSFSSIKTTHVPKCTCFICTTDLCKELEDVMEQPNFSWCLLITSGVVCTKARDDGKLANNTKDYYKTNGAHVVSFRLGNEVLEESIIEKDNTRVFLKYSDGRLRYECRVAGELVEFNITSNSGCKQLKYSFHNGVLFASTSKEKMHSSLLNCYPPSYDHTISWLDTQDGYCTESLNSSRFNHTRRVLSLNTGTLCMWSDEISGAIMEWDDITGLMMRWVTKRGERTGQYTEWKWSLLGCMMSVVSANSPVDIYIMNCVLRACLANSQTAMMSDITTILPNADKIELHVASNIEGVKDMVLTCSNHGVPIRYTAKVDDTSVQVESAFGGRQIITVVDEYDTTEVEWFRDGKLNKRHVSSNVTSCGFAVRYFASGFVCTCRKRNEDDFKVFEDGTMRDTAIDLDAVNDTMYINCNPVFLVQSRVVAILKPCEISPYAFWHQPILTAVIQEPIKKFFCYDIPPLPLRPRPIESASILTATSAVVAAAAAAVVKSAEVPISLENEKSECSICLDKESNCALIPCGHICVCEVCVKVCIGKKCPICNGDVSSFLKTYIC